MPVAEVASSIYWVVPRGATVLVPDAATLPIPEIVTFLALLVLQLSVAEFPDKMLEGLTANQFIAGAEGVVGNTCTSSAALTLPLELVALSV
jgi:hypothetical protein